MKAFIVCQVFEEPESGKSYSIESVWELREDADTEKDRLKTLFPTDQFTVQSWEMQVKKEVEKPVAEGFVEWIEDIHKETGFS